MCTRQPQAALLCDFLLYLIYRFFILHSFQRIYGNLFDYTWPLPISTIHISSNIRSLNCVMTILLRSVKIIRYNFAFNICLTNRSFLYNYLYRYFSYLFSCNITSPLHFFLRLSQVYLEMFKVDKPFKEEKALAKARAEAKAKAKAEAEAGEKDKSTSPKASNKDEDEAETEGADSEEETTQLPFLALSDIAHLLSLADTVVPASEKTELATKAATMAKDAVMPGWYTQLIPTNFRDASALSAATNAYDEQLAKLETGVETAKEHDDDTEILNAQLEVLRFKMLSGTPDARTFFEELFTKVTGVNMRIDLLFSALLYDMALGVSSPAVKESLRRLETVVERDGDWSRRNRLSAYRAVLLLARRELAQVAPLSVGSLTTFTSSELFTLDEFAIVAVLTAVTSMPRVDLKKKVISSPDLIQVFHDNGLLKDFLMSFYECRYGAFFRNLVQMSSVIKRNRYLAPAEDVLYRELRLAAYKQFLRSYRSVTVTSMATLFEVSPLFIEKEIAHFINSGRLLCLIDSVDGVIEMTSPETKSTALNQLLKDGDVLTSRVQKLTQKLKSV